MFFFFFLILMMINVAFYTLLERKIMGLSQTRLGPTKIIFLGILQPVFDGLKLFFKESNNMNLNNFFFFFSPIFSFIFSFYIWIFFFFFSVKMKMFILILIFSLGIYPLILSGWTSFSKFSYLGSIRASSQSVSYEIILFILLFSSCLLMMNINFFLEKNFFFFFFPLFFFWLLSILSETNRAPFDFSEGESELISGFNIEYGSTGFILFFLSEYCMMIFFSFLMSFIFNYFFFFFFLYILIFLRTILPRFRYDFLYSIMWFKLLPFLIFFFFFLMLLYKK